MLKNIKKNHYSIYVNLQESEYLLAMKINTLQYVKNSILCNISHWRDLNPRPADYKSAALPPELQWRSWDDISLLIKLSSYDKCPAGSKYRKTIYID
jgi:hypothetical protein